MRYEDYLNQAKKRGEITDDEAVISLKRFNVGKRHAINIPYYSKKMKRGTKALDTDF